MCGIVGVFNPDISKLFDGAILKRMTEKIGHRGPDDCRHWSRGNIGFGFQRLSLVDLDHGAQPVRNEDGSIITMCNGELFNYDELKKELLAKNHVLQTRNDCELIPHLYEEYGMGFLDRINGQFAMAIYDLRLNTLHIARDHFGINPLFYTFAEGTFVFASEIKAILEHPAVVRQVDVVGLDQIMCFPGMVSPRTMFNGVSSLKSGHYLSVNERGSVLKEYWDLDYPEIGQEDWYPDEKACVEQLTEELSISVSRRLKADVPVGIYLSGGLDSSVVAGLAHQISPEIRHQTFSVSFPQQETCERDYQHSMRERINSIHHEVPMAPEQVVQQLQKSVYHAECPLKESYDAACLALSCKARSQRVPAILTGQGADELFAGYIGYRIDKYYSEKDARTGPLTEREQKIRRQLWDDPSLVYDNNYAGLEDLRKNLYSDALNETLAGGSALDAPIINAERVKRRHPVHQRSYLDFKLRLSDHLLAEHGDRMAMAHAVELRHPFLDINVVNCAGKIPPDLKLKGYNEKYIVKEAARPYVEREIIEREKFGWYAAASPALMRSEPEWINELLSSDRIKSDGYFNAQTVGRLKQEYMSEDFTLNQPFESDILMIVLTFNLFLDTFQLSGR